MQSGAPGISSGVRVSGLGELVSIPRSNEALGWHLILQHIFPEIGHPPPFRIGVWIRKAKTISWSYEIDPVLYSHPLHYVIRVDVRDLDISLLGEGVIGSLVVLNEEGTEVITRCNEKRGPGPLLGASEFLLEAVSPQVVSGTTTISFNFTSAFISRNAFFRLLLTIHSESKGILCSLRSSPFRIFSKKIPLRKILRGTYSDDGPVSSKRPKLSTVSTTSSIEENSSSSYSSLHSFTQVSTSTASIEESGVNRPSPNEDVPPTAELS